MRRLAGAGDHLQHQSIVFHFSTCHLSYLKLPLIRLLSATPPPVAGVFMIFLSDDDVRGEHDYEV